MQKLFHTYSCLVSRTKVALKLENIEGGEKKDGRRNTHPRHSIPANPHLAGHRIIGWFELEGILQTILFQSPAMGRDTFHKTRLPHPTWP